MGDLIEDGSRNHAYTWQPNKVMFDASSKDYILLSLRIRALGKVQSSEQTGTASILSISLPVFAAYVVQLLAQLEYLHTCSGW